MICLQVQQTLLFQMSLATFQTAVLFKKLFHYLYIKSYEVIFVPAQRLKFNFQILKKKKKNTM